MDDLEEIIVTIPGMNIEDLKKAAKLTKNQKAKVRKILKENPEEITPVMKAKLISIADEGLEDILKN